MDDTRWYDSLVSRHVYDRYCQWLRADYYLPLYLRYRRGSSISCGIEGNRILVPHEGTRPGNVSLRCIGKVFKCDRCTLCGVCCLTLRMAWGVLGNRYP